MEQPQNQPTPFTVLIKSDRMGSGNDDLGKILIRGFLNALVKQSQLPTRIILYNSGVLLAVEGTDTATTLYELEHKGVEILLCGTCCDFFQIKGKIKAGTISNMVQITSTLIEAPKIVEP